MQDESPSSPTLGELVVRCLPDPDSSDTRSQLLATGQGSLRAVNTLLLSLPLKHWGGGVRWGIDVDKCWGKGVSILHKEVEKVLPETQKLLFSTCFVVLCVCVSCISEFPAEIRTRMEKTNIPG